MEEQGFIIHKCPMLSEKHAWLQIVYCMRREEETEGAVITPGTWQLLERTEILTSQKGKLTFFAFQSLNNTDGEKNEFLL